ncbi:MAG: hypothetical protein ACLSA9_08945 [Anaerovoracaceae bacterium]
MQGKQLEKKKLGRGFWVTLLVIIVLIPLTVGISWYMGDRKYYIASVLIMIYSIIPFFCRIRKPQASGKRAGYAGRHVRYSGSLEGGFYMGS